MANEIAVREDNAIMVQPQNSIFLSIERFEFAKKVAAMLAGSNMVPAQYQGTAGVGNCMIALNLAERLNVDVFGLMQTSYVVHGRPGFEAKLLIALFNANTRLFIPPLRWENKGDFPEGEDAGCRAYAKDRETHDILYGDWIDFNMVKKMGWFDKKGPDGTSSSNFWRTMKGQMFRYRAASFFINAYEPGLKMGIMTIDELEDSNIINVTPMPSHLPEEDATAKIHTAHEAIKKEAPAPIEQPFEGLGQDPREDKQGYGYLSEVGKLKKEIITLDGNDNAYYEALKIYDAKKSPQVKEMYRDTLISDLKRYIAGRNIDGPPITE